MAVTDVKTVRSQLRKGELHNLYYIFGQNIVDVEALTKKIIKAAVGDNEEFALNRLSGSELDPAVLRDTAEMMPMMTEYNCILVNDYNCETQREDVNKKVVEVLKNIPEHTVIIFNVTGFEPKTKLDRRSNTRSITDKNKKIADIAAKSGILCEAAVKSPGDLAKDIQASVSARGGSISIDNARELAEMCLSDTLTIRNEVDKLCAYAQGRDITSDMLRALVHRQNGVTVFNLADAVASFNKTAAFDALDELMADKNNRGAVLANITNSFIDMYRAACARKSGKQVQDVMNDFSYAWEFKVKNAFRDSSRMSIERLRRCICILRDTAMELNSTSTDEKTVLEETITRMLMTRN